MRDSKAPLMSSNHREGREPPVFTGSDSPFIFDTWWDFPDSSWGAVLPIMPVGPPSRDTISSTVMIVTSSLPFQLDAQFHLCVPQESQPHHPRLESPNRHLPPSYMQLDPSVSIQFCLLNVIQENVTEQRTMSVYELPDNVHVPYTEKCLDNSVVPGKQLW